MVTNQSFVADAPTNILSAQGAYQLYGRRASLITVNILLAFLQQFEILQAPNKSSKRFCWFRTIATDNDLVAFDEEEADTSILYICTADNAPRILETHPLAFLLVVSREGEVPEWAGRSHNRVVLIACNDRIVYISSLMQNLFTSMLVWESELDRVVASHGSLADLLEEGTRALNSFMAVTDAGYNDIAHTVSLEPPLPEFKQLIETGCYDSDTIKHIEQHVLPEYLRTKAPVLDESFADGLPRLIHYPIYYNGDYFFHLVMACNEEANIAAMLDLFQFFSARFSALCATFWDELILLNSPWHRVFTNLIDGVPMHDDYISQQLKLLDIPTHHKYCLLCFDLDKNDTPTKRSQINQAASSLNGGNCFPFAYNGKLLVLCHSDFETNSSFSVQKFARDIDNRAPEMGKIKVGISNPFNRIDDIRIAWQQAMTALNLSPFVDAESRFCGKKRTHYCYTFAGVMPYYLTLTVMHENEMSAFTSSSSILNVLAKEDQESGTDVVRLLWTYLCLERNATAASKQLHMHRNTVLYHIEKIEKRFGITMDDFLTRVALLDEFRIFFLTDKYTHEIEYERFTSIKHIKERIIL